MISNTIKLQAILLCFISLSVNLYLTVLSNSVGEREKKQLYEKNHIKPTGSSTSDNVTRELIKKNYNQWPLTFEENKGQVHTNAQFIAQSNSCKAHLSTNEIVFFLSEQADDDGIHVQFKNANPRPQILRENELLERSNYLIGNNKNQWIIDIPHYTKVSYKDIYPGIDLVYHSNNSQLEYDLIVFQGSKLDSISLTFQGIKPLKLDKTGDLVLENKFGRLHQHRPIAYQIINGKKSFIESKYVLKSKYEVGFQIAPYDPTIPLIIDPTVVYISYIRGGFDDVVSHIAVDSDGNAYVTGRTNSLSIATGNAVQNTFKGGTSDAFVTKFNSEGKVVYSTYLGGSFADIGTTIAVDSSGNAYISGITSSSDFPVFNSLQANYGGGLSDAFIAKINPTGDALIFSSFLGGARTDVGSGIAVDADNNIYLTGFTDSADFPLQSPLQNAIAGSSDIFVIKLQAVGDRLLYSTYIGGTDAENSFGITIDSIGNAYVVGTTSSMDFPTSNPLQAKYGGGTEGAFILKLSSEGNKLLFSTFIGGSSSDFGKAIAIDAERNIYITGGTRSINFPLMNALQAAYGGDAFDAFILKINATNNALIYSTFLGGRGLDFSEAISVDFAGNAIIAGSTNSTNFPIANPIANSIQATNAGQFDAFITKLNSLGNTLVYSTYLGGRKNAGGSGIALDKNNDAYIVGNTIPGTISLMLNQNLSIINPLDVIVGFDVFISKIQDPILVLDFSLSFNKTTVNITRGQNLQVDVNINRLNGFNEKVTISPSDTKKLKIKIKPQAITSTDSMVSFNLKAKKKSPIGTQHIVFVAKDESGHLRSNTVTVVVQ